MPIETESSNGRVLKEFFETRRCERAICEIISYMPMEKTDMQSEDRTAAMSLLLLLRFGTVVSKILDQKHNGGELCQVLPR